MSLISSLGEINLDALSKEITDNAVDIFVYDTRKDSDGGKWRKRTKKTSWYNETLNTATRGSRREFPAVAVIVLQSYTLKIYDGDDPDLPMWMVFNGGATLFFYAPGTAVKMMNGKLCWCTKPGVPETQEYWDGGLKVVDFISEQMNGYSWGRGMTQYGGVIKRNLGATAARDYSNLPKYTFVGGGQKANDVAMTVLPNAPIDPSTGLPVPTIAVGTDGGMSVIRDDGTVVDHLDGYRKVNRLTIDEKNKIMLYLGYPGNGYYPYTKYIDIPTSDYVNNSNYSESNPSPDFVYNAYSNVNISGLTRGGTSQIFNSIDSTKDKIFFGYIHKLSILDTTNESSSTDMVAYATTSYNTGWMHGDIKGAFLSDTDATNVTGTELVTNGTFDSDTSGWTADNATLSVVSGRLRVTNTAAFGEAYQQFTVEAGKTYVLSLECFTGTAGAAYYPSTSAPSVYTGGIPYETNITGVRSVTFVAPSSTLYLRLEVNTSSVGAYAEFDNISLRLAEEDRSVNNKGLAVYGTINKTPVATGAELVAYSGFNDSKYLFSPPQTNHPFSFGTGDFSIIFWHRCTSTTPDRIWFTIGRYATSNSIHALLYNSGGDGDEVIFSCGGNPISTDTEDGLWHNWVFCRKSGVLSLYKDATLINSKSDSTNIIGPDTYGTYIGTGLSNTSPFPYGANFLSLFRISASAPSAEQIKKIYEDEKVLFQENAKCTLYGSSDTVTALAYDDKTNLLHVGTSSGRSDFRGLRRINNTTTGITTAISASNKLIAEQ